MLPRTMLSTLIIIEFNELSPPAYRKHETIEANPFATETMDDLDSAVHLFSLANYPSSSDSYG